MALPSPGCGDHDPKDLAGKVEDKSSGRGLALKWDNIDAIRQRMRDGYNLVIHYDEKLKKNTNQEVEKLTGNVKANYFVLAPVCQMMFANGLVNIDGLEQEVKQLYSMYNVLANEKTVSKQAWAIRHLISVLKQSIKADTKDRTKPKRCPKDRRWLLGSASGEGPNQQEQSGLQSAALVAAEGAPSSVATTSQPPCPVGSQSIFDDEIKNTDEFPDTFVEDTFVEQSDTQATLVYEGADPSTGNGPKKDLSLKFDAAAKAAGSANVSAFDTMVVPSTPGVTLPGSSSKQDTAAAANPAQKASGEQPESSGSKCCKELVIEIQDSLHGESLPARPVATPMLADESRLPEAPKFPEIPETDHITRRQQLEAKQVTKGTRGRKPKTKNTEDVDAEPENPPEGVEVAQPKKKPRKTAAKSAPAKPNPGDQLDPAAPAQAVDVVAEGSSLEPPLKKPKTGSEGDVPDGGEGAVPKVKAAPKVRAKAAAKSTPKPSPKGKAKAKATPKSKAKAKAKARARGSGSAGSGGPQNRQFVNAEPSVPEVPVPVIGANPNPGPQDPNVDLVDADTLRSRTIEEVLQCLRCCHEVGTLNTKGKHEHQYEPLNYDLGERRWSVYWSRKAAGVKEMRDKKWTELVYFSRAEHLRAFKHGSHGWLVWLLRSDAFVAAVVLVYFATNFGAFGEVFKICWWMAHYGATSPKRHKAFCNNKAAARYNRGKLQLKKFREQQKEESKPTARYVDSKGRNRYHGLPGKLKSTQTLCFQKKFG
eukprot:s523_g12.t1